MNQSTTAQRLILTGFGLMVAATLTLDGCGLLPIPTDPSKRSTGPYLQLDSPDSTVVSWFTPDPSSGSVEVLDFTTGARVGVFNEETAQKHHVIHLTGLAPGAAYQYRLTGPAATDTDLHDLRVIPAGDSLVTFAVIGDSGAGSAAQYAIAGQIAARRPDYLLHVGDVVYPSGADNAYDSAFFQPYAAILDRTPILPCLGNHDVDTDDGAPYLENFILSRNGPAGLEERCYSIVLGDIQLVSIDRTRDDQTISGTIIPWIRQTFAASTARWRFLMMHYPVYHSGSSHHAIIQEDIDTWGSLCDELHIDLCLTGHNHFYERSVPLFAGGQVSPGQGTVYIVSGNGGQLLYPMNPPAGYSGAHEDRRFGFVELTASSTHLTLSEFDSDGNARDSVAWDKP